MASRPRSAKKRGWPDGLYERGGYFSWRNPLTGQEMGIGRVTLGEAKAQASEANVHVQGLRDKPRLVDRLAGREDNSWRAWLVEYERKLGLLPDKEPPPDAPPLSKNTRRSYRSLVKKMREVYAESLDLPLGRITTRIIADGLKTVKAQHARTAQAMQSRLQHSFDSAIADGWCETNPVTVTEDVQVKVQRARLTWEVFQKAIAAAELPSTKNAALLALVGGQPREVVCAAMFEDCGPVERPGMTPVECWKVTRGKTGAMIAIPLDLRLNVLGVSLREVIKQCRSTKVVSRYMVHNSTRRKGSRLGDPVPVNRLTKDFTAAIESLRIDWGDKTPPTFHEIRSLSKRLYKQQGGVNTKDLHGHKTEQMDDLYADPRGAEYKLVGIT